MSSSSSSPSSATAASSSSSSSSSTFAAAHSSSSSSSSSSSTTSATHAAASATLSQPTFSTSSSSSSSTSTTLPASSTTSRSNNLARETLKGRRPRSASLGNIDLSDSSTNSVHSSSSGAAPAGHKRRHSTSAISSHSSASSATSSTTHLHTNPISAPAGYIYTDPATHKQYQVRFIEETIHADGTSTFVQLGTGNDPTNTARFDALLQTLPLAQNGGTSHYVFDPVSRQASLETSLNKFDVVAKLEVYQAFEQHFVTNKTPFNKTPIAKNTLEAIVSGQQTTSSSAPSASRTANSAPTTNKRSPSGKVILAKPFDLSVCLAEDLRNAATSWEWTKTKDESSNETEKTVLDEAFVLGLGLLQNTNRSFDLIADINEDVADSKPKPFGFSTVTNHFQQAGIRSLSDLSLGDNPLQKPVVIPLLRPGHFIGLVIEPPLHPNPIGKIIFYDSLGKGLEAPEQEQELRMFWLKNRAVLGEPRNADGNSDTYELEIRHSVDPKQIAPDQAKEKIHCGAWFTRFVDLYFAQVADLTPPNPNTATEYRNQLANNFRTYLRNRPARSSYATPFPQPTPSSSTSAASASSSSPSSSSSSSSSSSFSSSRRPRTTARSKTPKRAPINQPTSGKNEATDSDDDLEDEFFDASSTPPSQADLPALSGSESDDD